MPLFRRKNWEFIGKTITVEVMGGHARIYDYTQVYHHATTFPTKMSPERAHFHFDFNASRTALSFLLNANHISYAPSRVDRVSSFQPFSGLDEDQPPPWLKLLK